MTFFSDENKLIVDLAHVRLIKVSPDIGVPFEGKCYVTFILDGGQLCDMFPLSVGNDLYKWFLEYKSSFMHGMELPNAAR